MRVLHFFPMLLSLATGCTTTPKDSDGDAVVDSGPGELGESGPTWYGGVGHLVIEECGACHQDGGLAAGLSFEDPALASALSAAIADATSSGSMPPFMAEVSDACENPWGWQHDPRLTDDELDLLDAWHAAGAPLGEPDPSHPLPPLPSADLADAEPPVKPIGSFTTEPIGDIQDDFICFTIDPELDRDRWLDGLQVVPGNDTVVHHVLVGIDNTGASAAVADDQGAYPCFGGFGDLPDVGFIGAWVPGSAPVTFPEHSALRVPAAARFVIQMHYHRAPTRETDQTGLALRYATTQPVREASIALLGNASRQNADGSGLQPGPDDPASGPAFLIPAGSDDHTETMYTPLFSGFTQPREVFLIGNHMHYIGTEMRAWLERGDDAPATDTDDTCLLHTPAWDFDWQQFFQFDNTQGPGPLVYPDDDLWLHCRYDNTLDNPGVADVLAESGLDAPIDIALGEGSLNEMCIAILGTVPHVDLTAEGETHAGQLEVTVSSSAFGFTQTCTGPASAALDGTDVSAVAACGLDLGGTLITLTAQASGHVDAGGILDTTVDFAAVEISGSVVGSIQGPADEATVSASGELAGGDIEIVGRVVLETL